MTCSINFLLFSFLVVVSEARDIPVSRTSNAKSKKSDNTCQNTESGKYFLTDSKGYLCERKNLNSVTGCCKSGVQHSCETCTNHDLCCSRYEDCVSCCLSPKHKPEEKYHTAFQVRNHEESGTWSTPFEYCAGYCRTWTYSTVHENAFLDDRRFCFSEFGRPLEIEETKTNSLLVSVSVISGEPGQDCEAACKAKSQKCEAGVFAELNSCNILREHFICEAGCGELEDSHGLEPYYITEAAQKRNFPAYCVKHEHKPEAEYDCTWKSPNVQRLCPCSSNKRI